MPRLPSTIPKSRTLTSLNLSQSRFLTTSRPLFSASDAKEGPGPKTTDSKAETSAHDSGPGWSGREGRDHAVKRPAYDVQSESAQQGIEDAQEGKEGSDAISRKDERNMNKKGQEEFPESPMVIGMNEERGAKDK